MALASTWQGMISPACVSTALRYARLADCLLDLRIRVQNNPIMPQSLHDNVGFGLVEHVAPVAVPAQEIMDFHAAGTQSLSEFQGRDAAAHHHSGFPAPGEFEDLASIIEPVQFNNAGQFVAGETGGYSQSPCGQQESVEGHLVAIVQHEFHAGQFFHLRMDASYFHGRQVFGRANDQLFFRHVSTQQISEARTRVEVVRFLADHGDGRGRVALTQGLCGTEPGNSRADDHVLRRHQSQPFAGMTRGMRSKQRTPRGQRLTHSPHVKQ